MRLVEKKDAKLHTGTREKSHFFPDRCFKGDVKNTWVFHREIPWIYSGKKIKTYPVAN